MLPAVIMFVHGKPSSGLAPGSVVNDYVSSTSTLFIVLHLLSLFSFTVLSFFHLACSLIHCHHFLSPSSKVLL